MRKTRVLYVSQEITPFLPKNDLADIARNLPQGIHEKGKEIRVFMPKYGSINERRHQLHEVIRLSGMNLVINDTDHPLIIKVASIPTARMQVYFIDNDDYFNRKAVLTDKSGTHFKDNDERSMFFCRGVLETVRKLGWSPDIIHCHGWFTALMPLYVKRYYKDDPHFADAKVVYSAYEGNPKMTLNQEFATKLKFDGFSDQDIDLVKNPTGINLHKLAMKFADGIVQGSKEFSAELKASFDSAEKNKLAYAEPGAYVKAYNDFYDEILEENSVLLD
jgi:starch synthase